MSSLNKVMLIGRLGKDPELRHTQNGKPVANFSLATSLKQDGKDVTEWHNVVVWDKQAETCAKFLSKGKMAYVEGRLATKQYDAKDGSKRTQVEVVASNVVFLSPKDEQQGASPAPAVGGFNLEDLPF